MFEQLGKFITLEDMSVGIGISETFISDLGLEQVIFPKETIIIEDKGYWDFKVIKDRILAENVFVTRIKDNTVYEV